MGKPERIGEVLKRVFADLEKVYGDRQGGRPEGPEPEALPLGGRLSSGKEGIRGGLDQALPPAPKQRLVSKS